MSRKPRQKRIQNKIKNGQEFIKYFKQQIEYELLDQNDNILNYEDFVYKKSGQEIRIRHKTCDTISTPRLERFWKHNSRCKNKDCFREKRTSHLRKDTRFWECLKKNNFKTVDPNFIYKNKKERVDLVHTTCGTEFNVLISNLVRGMANCSRCKYKNQQHLIQKLNIKRWSDKLFLTEEKLKIFLEKLYINRDIEKKSFKIENVVMKPDFTITNEKIIVEFDGKYHYTDPTAIWRDQRKDNILKNAGYKVIRIPYFIQLSTKMIKYYFNENYQYSQIYPHGFISDRAVLPASFCEAGIKRFRRELNDFPIEIKKEIIFSLKEKIKIKRHISIVVPESLYYLVK